MNVEEYLDNNEERSTISFYGKYGKFASYRRDVNQQFGISYTYVRDAHSMNMHTSSTPLICTTS